MKCTRGNAFAYERIENLLVTVANLALRTDWSVGKAIHRRWLLSKQIIQRYGLFDCQSQFNAFGTTLTVAFDNNLRDTHRPTREFNGFAENSLAWAAAKISDL